MSGHRPKEMELEARLREAVAAWRAYQRVGALTGRSKAALAHLQAASSHLAAAAPSLRQQVEEVVAELNRWQPPYAKADRWALVREVTTLRLEGVPAHRVSHLLIKLGACKGTGKPAEVAACITSMRKERHRWRQRSVTTPPSPGTDKEG